MRYICFIILILFAINLNVNAQGIKLGQLHPDVPGQICDLCPPDVVTFNSSCVGAIQVLNVNGQPVNVENSTYSYSAITNMLTISHCGEVLTQLNLASTTTEQCLLGVQEITVDGTTIELDNPTFSVDPVTGELVITKCGAEIGRVPMPANFDEACVAGVQTLTVDGTPVDIVNPIFGVDPATGELVVTKCGVEIGRADIPVAVATDCVAGVQTIMIDAQPVVIQNTVISVDVATGDIITTKCGVETSRIPIADIAPDLVIDSACIAGVQSFTINGTPLTILNNSFTVDPLTNDIIVGNCETEIGRIELGGVVDTGLCGTVTVGQESGNFLTCNILDTISTTCCDYSVVSLPFDCSMNGGGGPNSRVFLTGINGDLSFPNLEYTIGTDPPIDNYLNQNGFNNGGMSIDGRLILMLCEPVTSISAGVICNDGNFVQSTWVVNNPVNCVTTEDVIINTGDAAPDLQAIVGSANENVTVTQTIGPNGENVYAVGVTIPDVEHGLTNVSNLEAELIVDSDTSCVQRCFSDNNCGTVVLPPIGNIAAGYDSITNYINATNCGVGTEILSDSDICTSMITVPAGLSYTASLSGSIGSFATPANAEELEALLTSEFALLGISLIFDITLDIPTNNFLITATGFPAGFAPGAASVLRIDGGITATSFNAFDCLQYEFVLTANNEIELVNNPEITQEIIDIVSDFVDAIPDPPCPEFYQVPPSYVCPGTALVFPIRGLSGLYQLYGPAGDLLNSTPIDECYDSIDFTILPDLIGLPLGTANGVTYGLYTVVYTPLISAGCTGLQAVCNDVFEFLIIRDEGCTLTRIALNTKVPLASGDVVTNPLSSDDLSTYARGYLTENNLDSNTVLELIYDTEVCQMAQQMLLNADGDLSGEIGHHILDWDEGYSYEAVDANSFEQVSLVSNFREVLQGTTVPGLIWAYGGVRDANTGTWYQVHQNYGGAPAPIPTNQLVYPNATVLEHVVVYNTIWGQYEVVEEVCGLQAGSCQYRFFGNFLVVTPAGAEIELRPIVTPITDNLGNSFSDLESLIVDIPHGFPYEFQLDGSNIQPGLVITISYPALSPACPFFLEDGGLNFSSNIVGYVDEEIIEFQLMSSTPGAGITCTTPTPQSANISLNLPDLATSFEEACNEDQYYVYEYIDGNLVLVEEPCCDAGLVMVQDFGNGCGAVTVNDSTVNFATCCPEQLPETHATGISAETIIINIDSPTLPDSVSYTSGIVPGICLDNAVLIEAAIMAAIAAPGIPQPLCDEKTVTFAIPGTLIFQDPVPPNFNGFAFDLRFYFDNGNCTVSDVAHIVSYRDGDAARKCTITTAPNAGAIGTVLTAPNGTCYCDAVDNTGANVREVTTCP